MKGDTSSVVCKSVTSEDELDDALRLTAAAFKEEVSGSGMTAAQWVHFERELMLRDRHSWSTIGVAKRGSTTLGVVMLRSPFSKFTRRYCEPAAGSQGVGTKLMRWAEDAAFQILKEHRPSITRCELHLWVALDNAPARALYRKCGYEVVKDSRKEWLSFFWSPIHKSFLGYSNWLRMRKFLTLEACKEGHVAPTSGLSAVSDTTSKFGCGLETCKEGHVVLTSVLPAVPDTTSELDTESKVDNTSKFGFQSKKQQGLAPQQLHTPGDAVPPQASSDSIKALTLTPGALPKGLTHHF